PIEELGSRLSIAVLAGERAAVANDEIDRLVHERAPLRDARSRHHVEVDATVDASHPEVAVECRVVAVLREERAEVAEIPADPVDGDGGVLPSGPGRGLAGDERRRAETRFADVPDALLLLAIDEEPHAGCGASAGEVVHHATGPRLGLVARVRAELHHEPAVARWKHREVVPV